MNIDEIPTPESDNCYHECVLTPIPGNGLVMRSKMRDLERRLTIARGTLIVIADESANLKHAERMADRALKQTAPKP
jgi:hypothetical protein